MHIFVDEKNRVMAMNPTDMSGNTGWTPMPENLTGKTEEELFDRLHEQHGIPMYKVEDGAMIERTAEEIAADISAIPMPEENTPVTWDALAAAYQEGVNEA